MLYNRALRGQLRSLTMKTDADPTGFIATMDDLRLHLKDRGGETSNESYTDLIPHALTPVYQFVKDKSYELGDVFNDELLARIAIHFCIIQQSQEPLAPPVWGRGAAVVATASKTDQCHKGKNHGNVKLDSSSPAQGNRA